MTPNSYEQKIMRAASQRPVTTRTFTEGSQVLGVAPRFVEVYFNRLLEGGFIYQRSGQCFITKLGLVYLEGRDLVEADIKRHVPSGVYRGEKWILRNGAEDHKKFPSLGACGSHP